MRGSAPLLAALLAIAELIPSPAEAGDGLVRVVFGRCDALSADDVRALAAVELPGSTQPPRQPFPPAVVTVDCTESLVKLTLDDPITRKVLIRSVALSPAEATVRDRVIAIAIAELASASWIELAANPEPRAEPAGARPPVAVVAQATSASQRGSPERLDRRLRMSAVISTQVFSRTFTRFSVPVFGSPPTPGSIWGGPSTSSLPTATSTRTSARSRWTRRRSGPPPWRTEVGRGSAFEPVWAFAWASRASAACRPRRAR